MWDCTIVLHTRILSYHLRLTRAAPVPVEETKFLLLTTDDVYGVTYILQPVTGCSLHGIA